MEGDVPGGDMGLVHLERERPAETLPPYILREMTHAMTRPPAPPGEVSVSGGLLSLKGAVAQWYAADLAPHDVVVGATSTALLTGVLLAILAPGDAVIVPDAPNVAHLHSLVHLAGASVLTPPHPAAPPTATVGLTVAAEPDRSSHGPNQTLALDGTPPASTVAGDAADEWLAAVAGASRSRPRWCWSLRPAASPGALSHVRNGWALPLCVSCMAFGSLLIRCVRVLSLSISLSLSLSLSPSLSISLSLSLSLSCLFTFLHLFGLGLVRFRLYAMWGFVLMRTFRVST